MILDASEDQLDARRHRVQSLGMLRLAEDTGQSSSSGPSPIAPRMTAVPCATAPLGPGAKEHPMRRFIVDTL